MCPATFSKNSDRAWRNKMAPRYVSFSTTRQDVMRVRPSATGVDGSACTCKPFTQAAKPSVVSTSASARSPGCQESAGLARPRTARRPAHPLVPRPTRMVRSQPWPADRCGATSLLRIGDTAVGCWMRSLPGTRPLVVHPGWKIDLTTAVDIVAMTSAQRTPEPLRRARQPARRARAASSVD